MRRAGGWLSTSCWTQMVGEASWSPLTSWTQARGRCSPWAGAIHFPGGVPPARDSSCWYDPNTLCMRGEQPPGGLLALALACVLLLASAALTGLTRLGIQQLQLVRGPHRILLTAQELTFIHRPPSRRVGRQAPGWGGRQWPEAGLGP